LKEAFVFLGINFSARELMNIALSKQAGKVIFKTEVGVQLNLLHFDLTKWHVFVIGMALKAL